MTTYKILNEVLNCSLVSDASVITEAQRPRGNNLRKSQGTNPRRSELAQKLSGVRKGRDSARKDGDHTGANILDNNARKVSKNGGHSSASLSDMSSIEAKAKEISTHKKSPRQEKGYRGKSDFTTLQKIRTSIGI